MFFFKNHFSAFCLYVMTVQGFHYIFSLVRGTLGVDKGGFQVK